MNLSEKINGLAQSQMTDSERLQVLICLTAELAQLTKSSEASAHSDGTVAGSAQHEPEFLVEIP